MVFRFLLFSIFYVLASCSFKGSDSNGAEGVGKNGLQPKDILTVDEDETLIFNLINIYDDQDFYKKYELIRIESKQANVYIEGGDVYYIPFPHYFGTDQVSLFIKSKENNSSDIVKLTVEVKGKEDAPTLFEDIVSFSGDQLKVSVLENDIDVDGDELFLTAVDEVEGLKTSISGDRILLDPEESFDIPVGETLSFDYKVQDSKGNESNGKITLFNNTDSAPSLQKNEGIPLRMIFLKTEDSSVSQNLNLEADSKEALKVMNDKLKKNDQSFLGFYLHSFEEIEDTELFNMCDPTESSCIDYDKIVTRYNERGFVTLVFVQDIAGTVAGIARVNKLPRSFEATVVAEYFKSKLYGETIFTHELGHLLGLEHTQQIGEEENEWISYFSCGQGLRYFQRGGKAVETPYRDKDGVSWNDYNNTMRSVVSSADRGFFTEGYDPVFSRVFSCYRARSTE